MKIPVLSKTRIVLIVLVIGLVVFVVFSFKKVDITKEIEIQAISRGDVVEIVSETGFVQPSREVPLAFERGGRVNSISVISGAVVQKDDVLITLDTTDTEIELSSARARLEAEQVRLDELVKGADNLSVGVAQAAVDSAEVALQNAQANLEKVTSQQNQLVESMRRTLFSSGLEAYFANDAREDSPYSYTAPTITGTYTGEEEGAYTVSLYSSAAPSGASFRLTGMETDTQSVSTNNPQPLGSRGLYIQFPDNFVKGSGVIWGIPIPNTRSSSYLPNLNAYNATIQARAVAIESAENAVKSAETAVAQSNQQLIQVSSSARGERIEAQRSLVNQMSAAVQSAQNNLQNMSLRAPFSGVVTNIAVEEGEIISPTIPVGALISDDNFELVVNISESDIQEVNVGDSATVIFDAYDDVTFLAKVSEVMPNAKLVDGVRVFEVTLQFDEKDSRIRSGLSADIDILTAERRNVMVVPSRAVVEREDGRFVRSLTDGRIEYLPVKTGLRGSDGNTEILSGLTEGQNIISFAREDVIKQLESN